MTTPTLAFSTTLGEAVYNANRYRIILPLEEKGGTPSLVVYVDTKGIATIGAGFNIKAQAVSILTTILGRSPVLAEVSAITSAVAGSFAIGAAGDTAAQNTLNTALRTATGNNALSFSFASNAEVESTFVLIAKQFEDRVDSWLATCARSRGFAGCFFSKNLEGCIAVRPHPDLVCVRSHCLRVTRPQRSHTASMGETGHKWSGMHMDSVQSVIRLVTLEGLQ